MEQSMQKYIGMLLENRYEILEVIGSGGMSVVYKALDSRLNRFVAVKVLRDEIATDVELRARFQAEAQAVAMLAHPNIVAVYDVSHSKQMDYIVMELIEGVTMKQYLAEKGKLSAQETAFFAAQICKALQHAHDHGIVHRDIKPQNIMIDKDGVVKVADFGIAALENRNSSHRSDTAVGSVHYIAPEQARGLEADARSDLYSLGVVMYEMLTHTLPYDADTPEEIALKHISGTATPPHELADGIPPELERITCKAMNAVLDNRYQSAKEMLADLDQFKKDLSRKNGESTPKHKSKSRKKKERESVLGLGKELPDAQYARRKKRARRVSYFTAMFAMGAVAIGLALFLWSFMLRDMFTPAERIELPSFVGQNYEDVINSADNEEYNFTVVLKSDQNAKDGTILQQTPEAGKSVMRIPSGIDVTLTVSAGVIMTDVPYVINWNYQEATDKLQEAGFVVQQELEQSDTVTKDYVIRMDPEPGQSVVSGSVVKLIISGGTELRTVPMPDLTNLSESAAIARIESNGLTLGAVYREANNAPAGTVFRQSTASGTDIAQFSKIYIWVSTGPAAADGT